MKQKQLANLAVVFVVLALLVTLKNTRKPKELTTQEFASLNLSFDMELVASVDLFRPKEKDQEEYVEMVREDKGWKIKSFLNARADSKKIGDFLKAVQSAQGEIRGKDKSLFKDFGIGEEDAYGIRLQDSKGKNILDLRLGLKKVGSGSFFIRKEGSDLVYLSEADLFGKMGIYGDPKEESLGHDYWAAKNVLDLKPEEVKALEVKRPFKGEGTAAGVSRAPADLRSWKFHRTDLPFKIGPEKVINFIESFKTWGAQRIADPKEKDYGFDSPRWQLILTPVDGEPVTVTAVLPDPETKSVPIQVSSEPVVFLMAPYYAENMNADDGRFFEDNPLGVDAGKIQTLAVHADKKHFELHPKDKQWEGLTRYLEELKNFRPSKLIFDPEMKKKAKGGRYWIQIVKEGAPEPLFLDFGDKISDTEYVVSIRGNAYPFAAADAYFQQFFEDTARLEAPVEGKKGV